MGCGVSKLDPDEEPPAGLRRPSPRLRLIHRRNTTNNNNNNNNNARVRKDSIVSTTELLRLEDSETGDVDSPDRNEKAMAACPVLLSPLDEAGQGFSSTKADDDERRRLGSKPRRLPGKDEEELPGSPSFRFYFGGPGQGGHHPAVVAAAAEEEGSVKDGGGRSSSANYN